MPSGHRWAPAIALCAGVIGCADPIDAPSAFSGERYVCGPEHVAEFDALMEECRTLRQTSVCRGVLSLRGSIDAQDVTVDAHVTSLSVSDWPGGDPEFARAISVLAGSPYFNIKLDMNYLAVPPRASISGELPENCALTPTSSTTCMLLNLEARGGNYLVGMIHVVRTMELETAEEVRTSFSADLARGGHLEGCFQVILAPAL